MLNRLQAASRLLIRASLALFTGVVLLLIQSAFWSNRVSAWMQVVIFATALLSYFRPQYGLLALAALVPLGQVGSRTLDSQMRGAEALVLAFLAGALVRGWTLREFRTFPSRPLHVAALVFGFVVMASCIEQIWYAQIQTDFAGPFTRDLLTYASRNYITSSRGFGMLPRAILLLEGLALAVYTMRYANMSPRFLPRLTAMLIIGALATATLTLIAAGSEFVQTRQAGTSIVDFFARGRWSGHISDVNAAGSYFAMTAFLATGLAFAGERRHLAWLASGAVLFLAMVMTGSRTAVVASAVVAVFILVRLGASSRRFPVRMVSVAGALGAITAAAVLILRTTGATPSEAVSIRWFFLQATAGMLAAEPVFGVGVGQFSLWSAQFAPPALFKIWRPDNAHNNLAQIAGEMGMVGLAAFLAVLAVSFKARSGGSDANPLRGPLIAGLAAFIVTWLGGHPLLVGEAAFPFWIALGALAALAAPLPASHLLTGAVGVAAAALLLSIPLRVEAKSAELDLARVTYGLSARHVMTSRARFFVPIAQSRVDIPLRARGATDTAPVEIEVLVDGVASETITLGDRNWRTAHVELPHDASRQFHQIDLRIRRDPLDTINPGRASVEVGRWNIISKPNG